MAQSQVPKKTAPAKRKPMLSPELNEVLHMLKSLENDVPAAPGAAR